MSRSVMRKDLFAIFKIELTARAHIKIIMPVLSSELLILLQSDLAGWYITIVLWKDWTVVFKVKVTAKFQNFTECLSVLKFLYH